MSATGSRGMMRCVSLAVVPLGQKMGQGKKTNISDLAPKYPPKPIDIAPAINSARPPKITTRVFPSAERPAVSANGTVKPSERPIVASEMTRALIWNPTFSELPLRREASWASRSTKVVLDKSLLWREKGWRSDVLEEGSLGLTLALLSLPLGGTEAMAVP